MQVQKQKLSVHLNLAACYLKMGRVQDALLACTEAVKIDGTNVKALFRRGQARLSLNLIDGARSDLLEAAKREPQNRDVRKELEKLKAQAAVLKKKEKQQFG